MRGGGGASSPGTSPWVVLLSHVFLVRRWVNGERRGDGRVCVGREGIGTEA